MPLPTPRRPRSPVLLAVCVTLLATVIWARWPTNRVRFTSCQPAEVTYDELGPYCLYVKETIPQPCCGGGRHHSLVIGRSASAGHFADYTPNAQGRDMASYLEGAEVDWQPDGLTFREPSGHEVFVPAEQFTGGR